MDIKDLQCIYEKRTQIRMLNDFENKHTLQEASIRTPPIVNRIERPDQNSTHPDPGNRRVLWKTPATEFWKIPVNHSV